MGRISLQTDVLYDVRPLIKKSTARPTALFATCASLLLLACSQTNTPQSSTTASLGTWRSPGASPEGSAGGSSNTIYMRIGVTQTSNVALLGQEQVAGAKIAEKYFNDNGGVDGTPITLVFQDTGGDEQAAINALIDRDKVVGIVPLALSRCSLFRHSL